MFDATYYPRQLLRCYEALLATNSNCSILFRAVLLLDDVKNKQTSGCD